jgi:hypothetical protein
MASAASSAASRVAGRDRPANFTEFVACLRAKATPGARRQWVVGRRIATRNLRAPWIVEFMPVHDILYGAFLVLWFPVFLLIALWVNVISPAGRSPGADVVDPEKLED